MSIGPRQVTDLNGVPRPRASAKSVLLSVLGEFVLPSGGRVWSGTLVSALNTVGFTDSNARQAATRLASDGVIRSGRHGRQVRWDLTESGYQLLKTGAERIYHFGAKPRQWDRRWLVVSCHVPESQRELRRLLHRQLGFVGFGFLSSSLAVSPHLDLEPDVGEILDRLGLTQDSLVFRAEAGQITADESLVNRSWDLDGLASSYQRFVDEYSALHPSGSAETFKALVGLVHLWRQFPFADPELPFELLAPNWVGTTARTLFADRRAQWSAQAGEFFCQLEADNHRS